MDFGRALMLLFGALLLLYAGGCALSGFYRIASHINQTGHFPRGDFVLITMMIGIAVIIVSGLAGYMLIQATRDRFYDQALPVATQIADLTMLAYAGVIFLMGIYTVVYFAQPREYFEYSYLFGAWIIGFGLPGWKLFHWGRNYM